jgi:hypothetical protein
LPKEHITMPPRKNVDPPAVTSTPEAATPQFEEIPENPEDHSTPGPAEPSLAEAITLMTQELRNREPKKPSIKAKEPDTFDGSDPKKLNNFILLCSLYFRSSSSYDEDEAKVTFALSFLRGTALEFFEPSLLSPDDVPDWLEDWSVFVNTLRTNFGPLDPTADAEDSLDNLKMRENQRILKYNVDFTRLAIQTGWTDGVLRHRYYAGLAERIKDVMGQQGKPATLAAMKVLAHSIDARYWERIREKSRTENKNTAKSDTKTPSKSDNKSDNKTDKSNNNNNNKNKSSGSSNTNTNSKSAKPSTSATTSTSIADKLGTDGKLNSTERQRRFDNNLCLYCGGTGHKTADCKKAAANREKAKARAAQVLDKDKDGSKKA